jgi:zinc transporter
MTALEGVIHARRGDPLGHVADCPLTAFAEPWEGWRWLHLGRRSLEARDWLRGPGGLPDHAYAALIEPDLRPRLSVIDGGALLILRGVNRNPGAQPEDMVSLRLFVEPHRLITVEGRRLPAVDQRLAALDRGETPTLGATVLGLVAALREDAEPVLDDLQAAVDGFEIESIRSDAALPVRKRQALNDARHDAIQLHRHLAPQAEAVTRLARSRPAWLAKKERDQMRREGEAFGRIAEDLEAIRSRAVVISDEAGLRVAESTNRLLLRLSVVSMIFLPLTFFTGLLGVNLAGIPFAEEAWSFDAFALSVLGFAALLALALRRMGLL